MKLTKFKWQPSPPSPLPVLFILYYVQMQDSQWQLLGNGHCSWCFTAWHVAPDKLQYNRRMTHTTCHSHSAPSQSYLLAADNTTVHNFQLKGTNDGWTELLLFHWYYKGFLVR